MRSVSGETRAPWHETEARLLSSVVENLRAFQEVLRHQRREHHRAGLHAAVEATEQRIFEVGYQARTLARYARRKELQNSPLLACSRLAQRDNVKPMVRRRKG